MAVSSALCCLQTNLLTWDSAFVAGGKAWGHCHGTDCCCRNSYNICLSLPPSLWAVLRIEDRTWGLILASVLSLLGSHFHLESSYLCFRSNWDDRCGAYPMPGKFIESLEKSLTKISSMSIVAPVLMLSLSPSRCLFQFWVAT